MIVSIVAALLAAAANASSSVLQRMANRTEPSELSLSPRLILDLLHRKAWLGGVAAVTIGFLLQALALGNGQLSLVEPLLVLELPLTLLLAARVFHRRLHRREWLAIAGLTLGLMALVFSLSPTAGDRAAVSGLHWALATAATLAVVGALVAGGRRTGGSARAAFYGTATGTSFGLTATLIAATTAASSHGFATVFSTWQTYGFVVTGALGMFLLQSALQAGPLVAAQPGFTLADPVVAVILGVLLFGERVRTGPWLAGEIGGGLLMALATLALARSPLLHPDGRETSHAPSAQGRVGR